jgi:hypothetical protein
VDTNRNGIIFLERLSYQIPIKSVERFIGIIQKTVYGLTYTGLCYGRMWQKIETADNFLSMSLKNIFHILDAIMSQKDMASS